MPLALKLVALVVGLAVAWTAAPLGVRLEQGVDPELPVEAGLFVPGYGGDGTYGLHYRHGEEVTLTVPVRNDGPLPLDVEDVHLDRAPKPLLVPVDDNLPLSIGPFAEGEVELTFRFDNCRYYHERSALTWDSVAVEGSTLRRHFDREVELSYPLALHGQVIGDCPDRTLVRGDDVRPRS